MYEELKSPIKVYEYFVKNGDLQTRIVKIIGTYVGYDGETLYDIDYNGERRTRANMIVKIEDGVYQSRNWKDHYYLSKDDPKKALELFIKYYENKAEEARINLNRLTDKIEYLKWHLTNKSKGN